MSFVRCCPFVFAGLLLGCRDPGPPLYAAAGIVTLKGMPLDGAVVRFIPQGKTIGQGGDAVTEADGKYEITARGGNHKGLPDGAYKVVISRRRRPDGSKEAPDVPDIESDARETVPEPYCNPRDTPLTATVTTDGKAIDFSLPIKK
jgi:hypothetical protein